MRETSTRSTRLFTTNCGANQIIVDRNLAVYWNRIITILDYWNVKKFSYVCHRDGNPFTSTKSFQGSRGHKFHITVEFTYPINLYLKYFKFQPGVPVSIRYVATNWFLKKILNNLSLRLNSSFQKLFLESNGFVHCKESMTVKMRLKGRGLNMRSSFGSHLNYV